MSSASDILNLFRMAGGDASHYQEVEKAEQMQGSRGRWSMLSAVQPDGVAAAPVDIARDDAAGEAEAVRLAETAEAIPAAPERLIAWTIPAVASEPPPVLQSAPEQPDVQANPEPVVEVQQPADLNSVFARLLERDKPRADVSRRLAS
jgi:hypothetical protein